MDHRSSDLPIRQLSPSLYRIDEICNVYLIKKNERAILIDSGSGLVLEWVERMGIKQIDWVLHTHFHRDQCDGSTRLAGLGAKVAVPKQKAGYFSGADNVWRNRGVYDNYNTHNDFFAPIANMPVDRLLADEATFSWEGIDLRVIPAPGHSRCLSFNR